MFDLNDDKQNGQMLLDAIRSDFIGLTTLYPLRTGRVTRRHYLDSTASTLMMKTAFEAAGIFLRHYSNTHSTAYHSAKISTNAMRWAHDRVLSFLGADKEKYVCVFHGSGATGCANRLAMVFKALRPEKSVVLVSLMEHHSNDLPHRRHAAVVEHIPLLKEGNSLGPISLNALEEKLTAHAGKVNYVAVTGVSNVTGIINPIQTIAELAHHYGAYLLIDGAQMVAHMPIRLQCHNHPERDIDAFIFSGHKVYAPGSPGVLVVKKKLLEDVEPIELGGGIVDDVHQESYKVTNRFPDREHAGTPNITGAVTLAYALEVLDRIGMERIFEEEKTLIDGVMVRLRRIKGVEIYGHMDTKLYPRVGSIAFNLKGHDHGFISAALNDFHNVSVRNGCFCAHPYVRELLAESLWELDVSDKTDEEAEFFVNLKRGMVRASFGLYTNGEDIEALVRGLQDISANTDTYKTLYHPQKDGNYFSDSPWNDLGGIFCPEKMISTLLNRRLASLNSSSAHKEGNIHLGGAALNAKESECP